MASSSPSQSLLLISLSTLLLLLLLLLAAEAATAPAGPTPPPPLNLTDILVKGGQYTTFIRLLKETQYGTQLQTQLNNSYDGFTVFAPSDNAFNNLKPGTLNKLTNQQQVELIQYQVLPKFYTLTTFQTASNPVPTQASGSGGVYTVNVTSTTGQQVNVSTGVMETRVNNALYSAFPLSVYAIDEVLLPYALFGPKPPPAPASPPPAAGQKPKEGVGEASADGPSTKDNSGSSKGRRVMGWGTVVGVVMLVGVIW